MNFREITDKTGRYNFHSHSRYCDGHGSLEDYVRVALSERYTHYGFSPHSPIAIPSPCNMKTDDVPVYLAEVDMLKAAYKGRIELFAGMESDFLSPEHGPANAYFQSLPLDYRIGSVHFLPSLDGDGRYYDIDGPYKRFRRYVDTYYDSDLRKVVELYYSQSTMMVQCGGFDVLAHLDKIAQNGAQYMPDLEQQPWYREVLDAYLDTVIDSGLTVEINTKAYERTGRLFPIPDAIKKLRRGGVTLIVNSDSHYPDRITSGRAFIVTLFQ